MNSSGIPRKKALLAAIDGYPPGSGLTPLKYAEADALALDDLLKRQGFETCLLRGAEARRDALEAALMACGQETGGLFLFYFAGHGQLIRGSFHLHPVDSNRAGLRALPFQQCHDTWQSGFGYERVVAILDACRFELGGTRGPQPHTAEAARDIRAATHGRRQVEVLYGCSEGQVSYEDDELRHGVFTDCMLRAFQGHPDYLDTDLLAGATVDLMEEWSQRDLLERHQIAQRYHVPSLKHRVVLLGDPDLAAWKKARQENAVPAYEAYLKAYPAGLHVTEARAAIEELRETSDWTKAETENTVQACEKFLARWPQGNHAQKAENKAAQLKREAQDWEVARQTNTPAAYRSFLDSHPSASNTDSAKRRLAEIEADDQAWEKARLAQTLAAIEDYLKGAEEQRHRPEAVTLRRDLQDDQAWQQAMEARDLALVRDYQVFFGPNARHLPEAGQLRATLEAAEAASREAARAAEEARHLKELERVEAAKRRRRFRFRCVLALVTVGVVAAVGALVYELADQAERQRQVLEGKETELEAERRRRLAAEGQLTNTQADLGILNQRLATLTNQPSANVDQEALRKALAEKAALESRLRQLTNQLARPHVAALRPGLRDTLSQDLGKGVALELCGIPPGEFTMGSTKAERDWAAGPEGQGKAEWFTDEGEAPRLTQIKDGFWMGRTEVTVAQFRRFVEEKGYQTDAEKSGQAWCFDWGTNQWGWVKGKNWRDPNYGFPVKDEHPVACVSWNDAVAFCQWATEQAREAGRLPPGMVIRLPTEAEWEYACRGGRQGTKFWWGDTVADGKGRLNAASDDRLGSTLSNTTWNAKFPWSDGYAWVSPVDAFGVQGRNGFGLADMLGNVWEWCLDGYDPKGAHEECWTGDTGRRVLRGGSFNNDPGNVRCASRDRNLPSNTLAFNGFRVVMGLGG